MYVYILNIYLYTRHASFSEESKERNVIPLKSACVLRKDAITIGQNFLYLLFDGFGLGFYTGCNNTAATTYTITSSTLVHWSLVSTGCSLVEGKADLLGGKALPPIHFFGERHV